MKSDRPPASRFEHKESKRLRSLFCFRRFSRKRGAKFCLKTTVAVGVSADRSRRAGNTEVGRYENRGFRQSLTLAACRFARLRRFADAGHGRHWVRGAEYSKTGDEYVGSILRG